MKPTGELKLFNEIWEGYTPMKKKCKFENCDKVFHPLSTLDKYCPQHRYELKKANSITKSFKVQQKPNKPIKKVSVKRAELNKKYLILRKEFLKEHPMCMVKGCEFQSRDIHHTYDGSDRSKYFLVTDTWMAVCRVCHSWIHEHSIESKNLGYLK